VDPAIEVKPGEVLAGKYRIERVLGMGGMGVVVLATHLQLDERVAIKFLLPNALQMPEAVARFAREARAAVKIKSEHVARVTDVGTLETGCPYMVMEYLHGRDLAQLVQDQGPLPIEQAVDCLLQACEAIAEAHALGIVHRDLKPSNLFLIHRADGSACVKVLDFGISKTTGMAGSGPDLGMTRTTAVMGSPLYMSPEQMASARNVDVRTDIWALGAILYELCTGQVPFAADTMPQLCAMVLQEPAPPIRNRLPLAPEGLENAILRCLEKVPSNRYQNVAEFAAALLPFGPRWGSASVERISRVLAAAGQSVKPFEAAVSRPLPPATKGAISTQSAWGHSSEAPKRRGPWIVLGLAALAVALATAFGLDRLRESDVAAPTTGAAPTTDAAPTTGAASAERATVAPPSPSVLPVEPPRAAPSPPAPPPASKPAAPARASRRPAKVEAKPEPSASATPKPARPVSDLYSDRK
jgi:eukaryotic-like serine/threonine-protein kinase